MPRLALLSLPLILLLAGCADPEPAGIPAGTSQHSLGERTFRVHRPATLPAGQRVPLVLVLHGGAGSGEQAEESYGWDATAGRDGFLVVYPDGIGRSWNAGPGCCGRAAREDADDIGFLEEVVADVVARAPVDNTRVFVTGMSNGGMMTYRLACTSTVFRAVAPVAGMLIGDCPSPAPVSLLHIHGEADRSVPWAGGPGRQDNGGTGRVPVRIDGPPITEVAGNWRERAGCAAFTERAEGSVTTRTAVCPGGRIVTLISVAGAGHQWPGAVPEGRVVTGLLDLDPPSTALDATATIWRFFQATG